MSSLVGLICISLMVGETGLSPSHKLVGHLYVFVMFCFTNVSLGSLPKLRTVYCRDSKAKNKGLKVRIKISVENKLGPALSFSAANEIVFFSGCA